MKNEYPQFKNFVSYSEEKLSKKLGKSDFPFRITLRINWNGSEGGECEKIKQNVPRTKNMLRADCVLLRHKR